MMNLLFQMKKASLLSACAAIAIVFSAARVQAVSTRTLQGRLGLDAAVHADDRAALTLAAEYRLGNDDQRRYMHFEAGSLYHVARWFDAAVAFRVSRDEGDDDREYELRSRLQGTFKKFWKHIGIKNRNRFEHRLFTEEPNYWRYRNRTDIVVPFEAGTWVFKPYVADELFVNLTDGYLARNRLFAGLDFMFAKHIGMDVYYFWERVCNDPDRVNTSVIGAKLKFRY